MLTNPKKQFPGNHPKCLALLLCGAVLNIAAAEVQPAGDNKDDAAAINQALAQAKPGDTVTLAEGTFLLAAQLQVPGGVTLKGAGQEKTRLVFGGEDKHCLISLSKISKAEVCHLTLDGKSNPKALQGIVAGGCTSLSLHHLTIQNFTDAKTFGPHGILFSQTSDSVISDNTIRNIAAETDWGAGIRVGDLSLRDVIERNSIDKTGRGGIFTNNKSTDAVIRGNVITGSGGIAFAIEVHSGSDRTLVEDNVVDHGLSIVSGNCAVRRNLVTASDGTWKAYGIEGGGGPDGVVTGNIIHYGQIEGISLSGSAPHIFWAHNQFVCCTMWGMQIMGPSESDKIHSLYFYDNTFSRTFKGHPSAIYKGADGHAIRILNHTSHVVFDTNRIVDNAGLGFEIIGNDVNHLTFINNVITNNKMASIQGYTGDTVVWENNRVAGNGTNTVLKTQGTVGGMPHASFSAPSRVRAGEPVVFQNTSTDAEEITHVLWDFDDGIPSVERNPTYTYRKPGAYRVNLVVWNKQDNAAKATEQTIWVEGK